ncbi:MAG: squalene--hopene cyclase, partial [Bryobacteraceae bacterium]
MNTQLATPKSIETGAQEAMRRACANLADLQARDGHWCAELTADTTLESDYILFQLWLYPPAQGRWDPPTRRLIDKAVRSIFEWQLDDGGFNIYAGGPSEVSASVKAYVALKLAGMAIDDPRMARLRRRILELGGIQAANSYVKINLGLFDLYPRRYCPSIPPELVLLPFHLLYQMSAWTRAIVVSLSIVHAANPRRPVPAGFQLDELWLPGVSPALQRDPSWLSWHNVFLAADGFLKWWERSGLKAMRRKAVARAAEWMIERLDHSDGFGAIYPPMMYSVMALDVLGYAPDHPLRAEALRQFNSLMVDDGERFFFQPCFSPVWDTAISAYAAAQSELGARAAARAADWLIQREVRRQGDWSLKRPGTEPSGWAFEYANEFYPDIDDTAMVMLALSQARGSDADAQQAAERRAL